MNKDFLTKYNFITNNIILFILIFGGLVWADTNGIWHNANDIKAGTFGFDEGDITSNYVFLNPLTINDDLFLSNLNSCDGKLIVDSTGLVLCSIDESSKSLCDGSNVYLDGDGNCDIGYLDADGIDYGGPWEVSGTDVYYLDGDVGIGIEKPTEKLEVNGNIKANNLIMDSATTRDDSSDTVLTKAGLKNLFYHKEVLFTPPNPNDYNGQSISVYCDAGDIALECTWMPTPVGNAQARIQSYYMQYAGTTDWMAVVATKYIDNSGCKLGVFGYPYNKNSWTSYNVRVECLDVT